METPRIYLSSLPFGRFQIMVDHNGTTYENFLLFTKENKEDAEKLIGQIAKAMAAEINPIDALTETLWNDGTKADFKKSFYTSVIAKRQTAKSAPRGETPAEVAEIIGRNYDTMSSEERALFDAVYAYMAQTVNTLRQAL